MKEGCTGDMVRMLQCDVPGIVKILVSIVFLFFLLSFTGMVFFTSNRFENHSNSILVMFFSLMTKLSDLSIALISPKYYLYVVIKNKKVFKNKNIHRGRGERKASNGCSNEESLS